MRGRIAISETIRRNLLEYGRAHCRFDELRHDVLHNQIIKATLRRLAAAEDLNAALQHQLRVLVKALPKISDIRLSNSSFRRVQLSRNNGHYDLLLKICELVHSALLPEENGRGGKFAAILEDKERMSAVFQAFVHNFFKSEQAEFSVGSEYIYWDAKGADALSMAYLPAMLTDVTLRSSYRSIIIDAKFYKETLQEHYGRDRIQSEHLYQIFAYLKNFRAHTPIENPEGILLYPTTSRDLDLSYMIGGHKIRVATIQLNQPWQKIHAAMLGLLDLGTCCGSSANASEESSAARSLRPR